MIQKRYYHQFKIVCENCGRIVVKNNKQLSCSMKCRDELNMKKRLQKLSEECPRCKQIKPLIYRTEEVFVCSRVCGVSIYAARHMRVDNSVNRAPIAKLRFRDPCVVCPICKKEFSQTRYDQKFCSVKCNDAWSYKFGTKGKNRKEKEMQQRQLLEISIGACSLCGTSAQNILTKQKLGMINANVGKFHRDHIVPISQGGTNNESNLRWVCWFCNSARLNLSAQYDNAIAEAGRVFWRVIQGIQNSKQYFPAKELIKEA